MTALEFVGDPIVIRVPGEAAPQGSKTYLGRGRMRESSKRVKPWRAVVASLAEDQMTGRPLIAGPVRVEVDFVFARRASHVTTRGALSAAGRRLPFPYSRGDLDKLMRAIGDALTSVVLADDALIVSAAQDKRWAPIGEGSYTLISVREIAVSEEG